MQNQIDNQNHLNTAHAQQGIVDMVKSASRKRNRIAMTAGFIMGGWVPTVTYVISHYHVQELPVLWGLVFAGLAYSALTVFSWAKVAFKLPVKALGFVVLLEGAMTFVPNQWIGLSTLVLLIFINGLATGTNLVMDSRHGRQQMLAFRDKKGTSAVRRRKKEVVIPTDVLPQMDLSSSLA